MSYRILIGADLCPTETSRAAFEAADTRELLGERLEEVFFQADARILNLECPITDQKAPRPKHGPHLGAPSSVMPGIRALRPDLLSLANNHILDQGEQGLLSTLSQLDGNGLSHVGAGHTVSDAYQMHLLWAEGCRIGILSLTEKEFSQKADAEPHVACFDDLDTPDLIAEKKTLCDYLIVLYHGGREEYRYPSPELQRRIRKLAAKGADLVICQHSHCIGCVEQYAGAKLVYGLGNFLFDHKENEYWNNSLLLVLDGERQGDKMGWQVSFLPLVRKGSGIRLAECADAEAILNQFEERSRQILQPGFVEENYRAYNKDKYQVYLRRIFPVRWYHKVWNRLSGKRYFTGLFGTRELLSIRNLLSCETHREAFLEILDAELEKKTKNENKKKRS